MYAKKILIPALSVSAMLLLHSCACEDDPVTGRQAVPIFSYPHDDRLYAALECLPITPTVGNHPGPEYMGGTDGDRIAEGTHDDLEACALLLGRNEETLILISLDLLGILQPRVDKIKDRLEARDLDPCKVVVASTHTHTGPDSVGMFGPDWNLTGLDMIYQDHLVDVAEELVVAAGEAMVPVTATFATGTVNVPGSNYPSLMRDSRDPQVIDDRIHAIRFDGTDRGNVATLVNYTNHPETAIDFDWYSADYPRSLRERLTAEYGGGAIYFSGALGGLMTPIDVSVPARDEQGEPILEGGEQVWWTEDSWERTRSYGYVLAEIVIDLLDAEVPSPVERIDVAHTQFLVPITNVELWGAVVLGVVERMKIIRTQGCGLFGCGIGQASIITFGEAQITTSPGETFPETIIGREEVTIDYGAPWGPKTYEAIDGILGRYTKPLAMHFGLADNFIGYIIPECDFLPSGHPEEYCEYFAVSRTGETLLREALIELLDAQAAKESP
ncbi:hypothetical protein ACFL4G_00530 [Thermodesulfobacteriota bacterium]